MSHLRKIQSSGGAKGAITAAWHHALPVLWSNTLTPCMAARLPTASITVGSLSHEEPRLSLLCTLGEQEFTISAPTQVCLADGAKDECNVVEVVGRNHENQEIAVPVANLKLSCQPLVRGCFEDLCGDGCGELAISGCLCTFS